MFFHYRVIAELPRAKRASEAPWVRKIGNPPSRENLVMTSPYERTSVRPSVRPYRLRGRGGESRVNPYGGGEESYPFSVCCQQTIAEVNLTFLRRRCIKAKRKKNNQDNNRKIGRGNEEDCERELASAGEGPNSTE